MVIAVAMPPASYLRFAFGVKQSRRVAGMLSQASQTDCII
jgi:hypothetical protein